MPKSLPLFRKDDYLSLVQVFPLKRIRTESQHADALKTSGRLIGLNRKLSTGESQYLDALVVLIHEYEQAHHDLKMPKVRGVELLKHLLAEHKLAQKDLAKLLGVGEAAASMILSGARELTKSHISTLSNRFAVGVAAFFD